MRIFNWNFAAFAACLALSTPTIAATWTVDSTSADPALSACTSAPSDCSFPGAVNRLAPSGDTIVFTVTSSLATDVAIAKDVIIEAAGASLPRIRVSTSVGWATVVFRNARWQNINSGWDFGGALSIAPRQIVTIEDSQFLFNRTGNTGYGGAILNEGNLTVVRTRFEGNYSPQGAGAIHSTQTPPAPASTLTVTDSVFVANGLLNPTGPTPTRGQFGAIKTDGMTNIRNSLFYDNDAKYASAIQAGGPLLRVFNSTFWRNSTREATEGGALLLAGPTRIVNSTIVGNAGSSSGGLYVYPSSDTWLVNTIVADNLGTSPDIAGRVYSSGNNLIRNRTGAQIDGIVTGNIYDLAPRLAPLGNYGGPTLSLALLPDSPALNAGSNCVLVAGSCDGEPNIALTTDQRGVGFPRQRGAQVDIGAFELGSVVVTNNQNTGAGSLRQAISDAAAGDLIGFSSSYFNQARTITLSSPLVVNKAISVIGPGETLLTLDGNNSTRHLNVDALGVLNLSGMRFTRGNPGAGISAGSLQINLGSLNASDIRVDDSRAFSGGCIYNNGTLTLARARVSGCQANASAAVFNEAGKTATLSDVRIENSIATGPGGAIGNSGTLVLTRVSLSGNRGTTGGALFGASSGNVTLENVTVSGNQGDNGGGMYLQIGSTTTITHSTISANTAQFNGGVAAETNSLVNLKSTLIAGNTNTVAQSPDAAGTFTSFGYNLIGSGVGNSFAAGSPSLLGNFVGAAARLAPLADNGGFSLTHAPLYNSLLDDGGGPGLTVDARGLVRPIDFSDLVNANGGNGSDIGAYEIQVSTPTNVIASAAASGSLSISFSGGANGGPVITSYSVTCANQSASGSASPIVVGGLATGVPVTCAVTASSGTLTGIPSGPSNSAAPALVPGVPNIGTAVAGNGQVSVVFSAPASNGGSEITGYTATCGARTASAASSPISVIGLINSVAVSCTVTAQNTVGSGPASSASNSVTPGLAGVFAHVPKVAAADAAVINVSNGTVAATIGLVSGQSGVAASPDGARVYFVNQAGDDVTVINTQTNSIVTRIPVPNRPWSAVVSPDSSMIYVTQSSGSAISVISAASNSIVATIPGVNSGYGIAITPDGKRLYVAAAGGAFVYTVDTVTYAVATIGVGLEPVHVAVSADGTRAYVSAQTGNNLTVIDTASATAIATIPVGNAPYGVAVSPNSSRVYVANSVSNTVSVIDANALAVMATVSVGSGPRGIDVSPDGSRVYVVLAGGSALQIIDTASQTLIGVTSLGTNTQPLAMGRFMALAGVAPSFTSGAPANGSFGVPYSHTLNATGAPAPSFAVSTGTLPPGLSLNSATGQISGTPTSAGTYTGAIRASNGVGTQASQAFSIQTVWTVPDAPIVGTATAGDGSVTLSFTPPINDGGSPILFYNLWCSVIGAGNSSPITLNGLPNGVPQNCRVNAINAIGPGPLSAFANTVTPQLATSLSIATSASPSIAGASVSFTATLAPSSATGTVSFNTGAGSSGCAPMTINAGIAVCTTTFTTAGARQISANYSGDGAHRASSAQMPGSQVVNAPTITIAPGLSGGVVGTPYGPVQLLAAGGVAPHQFSVLSGSLPNGVTLTSQGLLSGTPSAFGTFNFTINASDANNFAGIRAYSVNVVSVPNAPSIGTATRGNALVNVAFTAPNVTGGSAITGYTATCGAQSNTGTTSPIVVSNLSNGTAVTCTVVASNIVGNSLASAASNSVTPATVPNAPSIGTATRGNALVNVAFTAPNVAGGSAITGYTATCGAQSNTGTTSPIVVSGLTNGTAVTCTVVASNIVGSSLASAASNSVIPGAVPGAPIIALATPGNGTATVTFTAPTQTGGLAILDYTLSCLSAIASGGGSVTGSGSPLTVIGLNNGVIYGCSVSAHNAIGDGAPSSLLLVIPAAVLSANLSISMSNGTNFVTGGAPVTYLITVSNAGPAGVVDARVQDVLDVDFSNASWICVSQNGALCPGSGSGNLDQLVTLPVGSSVRFELTATVAALPETMIMNVASVTAPTPIDDPNLADNVASDGPDLRGLFRNGFE